MSNTKDIQLPKIPEGMILAMVPGDTKVPEGFKDTGIKMPVIMCKYDSTQKADRFCFICGDGLCSAGSCGYRIHEQSVCNECWSEYGFDRTDESMDRYEIEDITGICLSCGEPLEAIMENNGFTEPEGPSHWEVAGYKPCQCGREDEE